MTTFSPRIEPADHHATNRANREAATIALIRRIRRLPHLDPDLSEALITAVREVPAAKQ
jgi:hypothetical protein